MFSNMYVIGECTKEQCLENAKYILSVARKIGASTFLVPEDIVEVKAKVSDEWR